MDAKVLPSKLLVSQKKKEDKVTNAGLFIPASTDKDPCITGVVEAFGDSTHTIIGTQVIEGLTVLFSPHSYQRVKYQERELMIVDSRDVLLYW